MFKRLLVLALAGALLNLTCAGSAAAATESEKQARFAEKVKAGVAKLGTGPEARIEVSLRDGTKLKGYVSEARDDGFAVTDPKTGAATQVAYPQVKVAKGNNLASEYKFAIAIGALILLIVVIASQTR